MSLLQCFLLVFACISLTSSGFECKRPYPRLLHYGDDCRDKNATMGINVLLERTHYFYGQGYNNLTISTNGLLSFGEVDPGTCQVNTSDTSNRPLITGFCTELSNVKIYYETLQLNNDEATRYRFKASSDETMRYLRRKFGCMNDFSPTHITVFTWVNGSRAQYAQFQIALVSQSISQKTYALLLYNEIEWNYVEGLQVGFSHQNQSYILPFNVSNLDNRSNIGISGIYVYRIDQEQITDREKTTDGPLTLNFINDTPYVSEYELMANFEANKYDIEMNCSIPRLGIAKENCISGCFYRNFTWGECGVKRYTLIVEAKDPVTKKMVTLRGKFRVFGHQQDYFCSVNTINTGTPPIPRGGSVEYVSVGRNITNFTCWIIHLPSHTMITKSDECGEKMRDNKHGKAIYSIQIPKLNELMPGKTYRLVVQPTEGCMYDICHKRLAYTFQVAV